MASELFSFKVLIHSYSLNRSFYSHSRINRPAFAVHLFDFPVFVVYSQDTSSQHQVRDQWIKVGNGKSTAFEMSENEMYALVNEKPLIVNFVDAQNQQIQMFSRAVVTLRSFQNDLGHFFDKNQENWRRKVFQMYDDTKQEVGSLDLSISLTKKRRNVFNTLQRNDFPDFSNAHPQSPRPQQQSNNSYFKPIQELNRSSMQGFPENVPNNYNMSNANDPMRDRPRTSGYPNDNRQFASQNNGYDGFESGNLQSTFGQQNGQDQGIDGRETIDRNARKPEGDKMLVGNQITLRTIVEGHYCPPTMILQKKKKVVRFAGNEEKPDTKSVGFASTGLDSDFKTKSFGGRLSPKYSNKNLSVSTWKKNTQVSDEQANQPEEQSRPVVVLSNKESEKIVDLLGLKNNLDPNFSLIDLLIKELVALRHPDVKRTSDPIAQAESLQFGSFRNVEVPKDSKPHQISRRKSSFSKDAPTEKNKENVESNNYYFGAVSSPPKKSRNDFKNSLRMSRDIASEIIKETHEEEMNAVDEDYSQDFESISASQSLPNIGSNAPGKKFISVPTPKSGNNGPQQIERMESIEESYADDFENLSQASGSYNIPAKYGKNYNVKTNNRDMDDTVSEDLAESASRSFNQTPVYLKKDSFRGRDADRRDTKLSEYSEDFEEMSEDYG